MKYKDFAISELYEPVRGNSQYTRAYAERNPGEYPVYSAALAGPLCYINSYDYDGTYLSWTTNGYGGRVQILEGRFSINSDRGVLLPKMHPSPDPAFIKNCLEPILISQAVGRIVDGGKNEYTKVSPDIVNSAIMSLPVDGGGNIDTRLIDALGKKAQKVRVFKEALQQSYDELMDTEVLVECEAPYIEISLGDDTKFDLSIGKRVLRRDIHESGVPVYSANVKKPFGYIKESNLKDFDKDSIIWGIDGGFDWNIMRKGIVFATTDHSGRVKIKSEDLDPEYVYYALRATRYEYGFDRVYRASLGNIKQTVHIKVPINENGEPCLRRQMILAKRYRGLDELKFKTGEALKNIL